MTIRKDIHTFHKYVLLPCLTEKMRMAGATLVTLAEASGVSENTISNARKGGRVRPAIAGYIYEALNTRKFKRKGKYRSTWSQKRIDSQHKNL